MAKLNRDDHKGNDRGARIIKAILGILAIFGAFFLGSKIRDTKSNDNDEDNDNDEFE